MANYSGRSGSGLGWFYPGAFPAFPPRYTRLPGDLSIIPDGEPVLPGTGAIVDNIDVSNEGYHYGVGGTSAQRFFLYDTVHVYDLDSEGTPIAPSFSLGSVTNNVEVVAYVWNAFFTPTYVDPFSAEGDATGIENRFPYHPTPPVQLAPLEETPWQFLVRGDVGPPTFRTLFSLMTFPVNKPNQPAGLVVLQGSRSQLLSFAHNWIASLTETLQWLTAVNTAEDGTEHRAALRAVARRTIDMTLYLTRDSARKLDHLLHAKQNEFFITPLPQFTAKTTEYIHQGSSYIFCDTSGKGFTPGSALIVMDAVESDGFPAAIQYVDSWGVSIVGVVPFDLPRGSLVMPAGNARFVGPVELTWQTKDFATGVARLEFQPTYVPSYTPGYSSGYDSYSPNIEDEAYTYDILYHEVLGLEPDWAGGLSKSLDYPVGITDGQTGAITLYKTHRLGNRTITTNWLLKSSAEVENFRQFLFRRLGRQKPFWAPSWTNDLRSVHRDYVEGDNEFVFFDNGFMDYSFIEDYADPANQQRANLQIQLKDGTIFRSRIASAESLGYSDDEEGKLVTKIVFAETYPKNFKSWQILRVSWLNLYRLADDNVTFEWLAMGVAKVSLPITTVLDTLADPRYDGGEE